MRRTTAVLSILLVTILTLIGVSDPADAAPTSARDRGCQLVATPHLSGSITSSVTLAFSSFGVEFLVTPAWSYAVSSGGTSAVVAAKSFASNNSQQDTFNTTGWKTGSYTAVANFGDMYPTCSTTFQVQGVDDVDPGNGEQPNDPAPVHPSPAPHDDQPPTATIDCGPSEVTLGTTIKATGTAHDDQGISDEKVRFPDGTENAGNIGTWQAGTVGEIAFAYFVVDTAGSQAHDICYVDIVTAPPVPIESPTPPPAATSTPVPTSVPADTSTTDSGAGSSTADAEPDTTETGTENENSSSTAETTNKSVDDPAIDQPVGDAVVAVEDAELEAERPAQSTESGDDIEGQAAVIVDPSDTPNGGAAEVPTEAASNASDAFKDTIAIAVKASADDVATPVDEPTNSPGGINVPWWFLVLITALAAYKPVTDLWRNLTRPGRVQPHQNGTLFES